MDVKVGRNAPDGDMVGIEQDAQHQHVVDKGIPPPRLQDNQDSVYQCAGHRRQDHTRAFVNGRGLGIGVGPCWAHIRVGILGLAYFTMGLMAYVNPLLQTLLVNILA